ncbi:MAG: site-specific integrase [Oscillospiraceae bacterium]|nr:site-specific integrase [Oscillospiraceae bacterium]
MKKLFRSTFMYCGKRYERTSTVSKEEADKKAEKHKRDLEDGLVGISKKMRVKAWAREWLEVYKKPGITEKSYRNYKRYIDKVIIPQIGELRLIEVTDVHLQKLMNSRAGKSYSDLKHLRDTVKAIFRKARESRLINYDPAEFLILPQYTKGKRRSLTDFEREHFLRVAEQHPSGLMFLMMYYCGLRPGERDALDWRHIDFIRHRIKIEKAVESGTTNIKAPKTAAGVREVPIPDELYHKLLERRGDPFSPVFAQSTTGRRHTETSRAKSWKSIIKALDDSMGAKWGKVKAKDGKMRLKKIVSVIAPDLVPYCLRHTYCTDLQRKGVPLKTASYLMGHATIAITADIYTHITEDMLNEAAQKIGASSSVTDQSQSHKTA